MRTRLTLALLLLTATTTTAVGQQQDELTKLTGQLAQVGTQGKGHAAAQTAFRQLVAMPPARLVDILARMPEGNVLADNWFRSVVESLADRAAKAKQPLPIEELNTFLNDRTQAPRARWLAYELLVRVHPEQSETLVEHRLDDPCLPLRREAVRLALLKAQGIEDKTARIGAYRSALAAARDRAADAAPVAVCVRRASSLATAARMRRVSRRKSTSRRASASMACDVRRTGE